jgi:hypothetical protein
MKKFKLKINEDTMTTIVVSSLFFCVSITIAGLVMACYSIDVSSIVSSTHTVFGFELGVCGLLKIFDYRIEKRKKQEDVNNG